ncbi:Odorant receptor 392 [Nylanderia fulva]|uniref:Odorant receptor 392 n=1 Tax=Nylanderia fulva TaxID=613905 RepID=A0A6G1LPP4_9HYME|nr:Odorant receptor 392 [Nylanderia fulva]
MCIIELLIIVFIAKGVKKFKQVELYVVCFKTCSITLYSLRNIIILDVVEYKSCSIKYLLYVMSSVTTILIKIWLPYDINASSIFWIISIQQIMCMFFAGIINSDTDSLIFGLSLQMCAQFEIYKNRLQIELIQHYYRFAKTINIIFNQMLFAQFFGSILILYTSIYYVSTHLTESENSTLIIYCIYTFGMLMHIYILCWCGNESMSIGVAIYHMDWHLLATSEKKELLIIMIVQFLLSLLILKASYSAFNVLQKRNRYSRKCI